MSKAKKFNTSITECSKKLDECAWLIQKVDHMATQRNLLKIGTALSELGELREDFYKHYPDMKPEGWDEGMPDSWYEETLEEALIDSKKMCDTGNPLDAIKHLELLISIRPPVAVVTSAKHEIGRIKSEFGV